jgi:1-acyl-sn-glycerol-3-phosphate acyltransferase
VRAAGRALLLALWLLLCLPPHLISKLLTGRSRWPPLFLAGAAWICGARATLRGDPLRPHSLLVCNHVSWLDILVVAGATGCAFVSKDDLGHPLVNWLADQNGTLYVRREHRRGAKDQAITIAKALEGEQAVGIFPEGTVGPGNHLLPFRPTLLEAVNFAREDVEVRPVAIDYGRHATEIAWYAESAKDNVLRVLGRKGRLPVTVHLLPPLQRTDDRKALASEARQAIGETLASSRGSAPLYARSR